VRFLRNLRHLPSSAYKFLIFAVICVVLGGVLLLKVGQISLFTSRHTVYADLNDVTGLTSGNTVDIAGVPIGQVGSISEDHGHAVVGLSINNAVVLHRATDVGIRWRNVIGQKEIYLYPSPGGSVIANDGTIPLTHDVSDKSVNDFLNSFGPFLSAINPKQANEFVESVSGALQNDTAQINQLINNGAVVSKTIGSLDTQVAQIISSLDQVLTAIASRSGDVSSLVANLQTVASALSSKNDVLDSVVTNLGAVAGDLGNLLSTNHNDLNDAVSNLNAVSADIVNNQQALAATLSTLGTGLAPYIEISSFGQWFDIQTVYTCVANQTTCTYYQPTNTPPASGLLGGPPFATPAVTTKPNSSSSIGSMFGNVAGAKK
jgi:phospholipid/cholesterol/gamma-HCH transport system substrate-binding protein